MSVSMRNTKAQMYAAYEEYAEMKRLRAASQTLDLSERRAKLEALKAFAAKFHCTARLRDGVIELYSKKRGCWVAVPEGAQP